MTWKEVLQTTGGRWAMFFCLATAAIMVFYVPDFYQNTIAPKKGPILDDAFLNLFNPFDCSIAIFTILYLAVIQTLVLGLKRPSVMMLGITTYCAVSLLRMASMYLVTLEPPTGMILLIDPISSSLYPDNNFAKDLFFSGHVSTMMILVLLDGNKTTKWLKIVGTSIMGLFLAWQHVHYTIDLVVAPVVTYVVFAQIRRILDLT